MFEVNLSALLNNLYYHPELTQHVGDKYSGNYPSFVAIAITAEPHQPSLVFIFSDFEKGALPFMFKEGVEAVRKEFKTGQWSPGQNAVKDKIIFGFFTHQNENFIKAMLKQLGVEDSSQINKIINQFKDPKDLTKTPTLTGKKKAT
ncbi:MAG: hypothetical protein SFW07_02860 [Gammaproteobacteria bacterium]|nr:hypothetical protein [Gammaproteobacteria bacterium]